MPGERALSVVIVSAGFGGLAAAIELRRHGFADVTVLERTGHRRDVALQRLPGLCVRRAEPPVLVLVRAAPALVADLLSSHYLPALQRPNVELVATPIARFVGPGVITADGVLREVDCVIWGTGFRATEFMFPMEIAGAGGWTLREEWADGAHAHLGVCVPGFPSLFLMYGPNTNTSGGSIVFYEETQAAYIRQALEQLGVRRAASISVLPEVEAASDQEVQAGFAGTAWTECDSWYRDRSGRIVANWPGYMTQYAERLRVLDPDEYEFRAAAGGLNSGGDD